MKFEEAEEVFFKTAAVLRARINSQEQNASNADPSQEQIMNNAENPTQEQGVNNAENPSRDQTNDTVEQNTEDAGALNMQPEQKAPPNTSNKWKQMDHEVDELVSAVDIICANLNSLMVSIKNHQQCRQFTRSYRFIKRYIRTMPGTVRTYVEPIVGPYGGEEVAI